MRYVVDIETTSATDLTSCGTYSYANDASTRILCIAWADADVPIAEPELWRCDGDKRDVLQFIASCREFPERITKLFGGFVMSNYINEYFDTGFLSPGINFALFCASFVLAVTAFVWSILI